VKTRMANIAIFTAISCVPLVAQADLFGLWVTGKSGFVSGNAAVFDTFDQKIGNGAEAGIELLGIEVWGEALNMGTEQYLMTANLGFDVGFGDTWRFNMGAYTGPMFFMFPEQEKDPFVLPNTVRSALTASGIDPTMIESSYNEQFRKKEQKLERYSFGWNLIRARLQVERKLAPLIFVGIEGEAGYHYLITGAEVAAEAKSAAVDTLDEQYQLSRVDPGIPDALRNIVGAEDVEPEDLGGINYNLGLYLKIEI
jgi:hypothetical protein